jgi:hypothetical protein
MCDHQNIFTFFPEILYHFLMSIIYMYVNIVNGINLSTYGGLVWLKDRSFADSHLLADTVQGATKYLVSNTTAAQTTDTNSLKSFNTNGFTVGSNGAINGNGDSEVSWTFRKQPKFFNVVTYTGTGSNATIAHNLGSVPGCIIVKRTDTTADWQVYHNGLTSAAYSIQLDLTNAQASATTVWNSTAPTSTVFSVGTSTDVNASGGTYVAYLFAHNAGGFGLTGTDNVISCDTFTSDASGNATVNLGYEPQFVIYKPSAVTGNWFITDTMRGLNSSVNGGSVLYANTSGAEVAGGSQIAINATGFTYASSPNKAYIYIAIRRGPMAVPTDATKVFAPVTSSNDSNPVTTNFPVDFYWDINRAGNSLNASTMDRLRGSSVYLSTSNTNAEANSGSGSAVFTSNTTVTPNFFLSSVVVEAFRRAPSFFDEVCYTGTATAGQTYTHNLGVPPELMIIKSRSGSRAWQVYSANLTTAYYLTLNSTNAQAADGGGGDWYGTAPTSTVFSVGTNFTVNNTGETYVAYLFATCAGVSKVGSYTGNGSTQAIACGFTGGARFVLIKRTDSTGDWYVYDTARGMTTLTDPYLLLNSTAAESATLGSVTTTTGGFTVNAAILAAINTSSASYIFLAIA